MKRKSLLMMMLLCFALIGVARAQVTIGDLETAGNDTYLPMNSLYEYSYSQQIYTAEEIGTAGTINAITIWLYGSADLYEMPFDIYMLEVDQDAFASTTDWISVTASDIVYSGSVTVHNTEVEAYTFTLDSPFTYSGAGNLMIAFDNNTGSWKGGLNGKVFTATDNLNRSLYARRDSNDYDPTNMSAVTASGITAKRNVIEIDITSSGGPTCDKPENLVVSDITGYSATCTWESSVGNYTFEYKKASDSDWTVVSGLTAKTYTLSNLESMTAYNTRVKAVCGADLESGYRSANFTTLEVCPDGLVCIGQGTATNAYLPTHNYYNYSLTEQIYTADEIGKAGAIESVDIFSAGSVSRNLEFYMVSTEKETFADATDWIVATASDLVYSGSVSFVANTWNTIEFDTPFVYDGQSNVALVVRDMTGSYVPAVNFYVFDAPSQAIRAYRDGSPYDLADPGSGTVLNVKNRLRLAIGEPPACPKPTGLTVNYNGGTTAEVSWTSDATNFNIDVNGTVTNNVSNPYTLTGLDLATTYTVMVQANCGADGLSEWTAPVSFKTDLCMPEDMCAISLDLVDSYGDGWNGAALQVYDYDETTEELTLLSQFTLGSSTSEGSFTLNVCTDRILVFYWSAGSYDSECSYAVYDNLGDKIFSGSGAMTDYEIFEMNCNSTCRTPTDFAASNINGFSAELSWTENGEATSWTMAYMAAADTVVSYVENITANPYLFEGLTPNTTYYAMIKADCEDAEKWSDVITFTTTDPCPKPVVTVDPTTNSATVTWTGFSESYDLEWTVQPTSKDPYSEEGWYYYDNGTNYSGVGLSGNPFSWGVMFPAGSFEGSLLSTVRVYDYAEMEGSLTIYNDGADAPGSEVFTTSVSMTGTGAFVDFEVGQLIDPTKNVWVIMHFESGATYAAGTCQDVNGDANGRWVEIQGSWYDLANAGVTGQAFMIRAHFEPGYDPSELNWTSVPGATSPYVIEGLEPETTYIVRVMGHCGDDGDSNWTTVTFKTVALCATPTNLVAEPNATSAELSWSNYQESYNLYYRYRLPGDPTAPATVILTAGDVWEDGSGYQMLLDADATAYGTIIPTTGALTTGGDVSDEIYAEFEYKIPVDADGALTTENIVINNSIAIEIPAGTYDWCITNPTPGDRMWIAASNGIGGRYDDFVFEAGKTYEFTVRRYEGNDGVDLLVGPMSDWTVLDNVTTPYTLTGLTPNTYYEWKVEGVNKSCEGGVTEQSEVHTFTTLEAPSTVDQTLELSTGWTWMSLYVESSDELFQAIKDGIAENNTTAMIKAEDGSIMLQNGGWSAGIVSLENEKMYMTTMATPATVTLTAAPADPAAHPITIRTGWNWIGFISSEEMALSEALAGITPTPGDMIKTDGGASSYTANGWEGSLSSLEPGKGYMYNNKGADLTLVYPASAKGVVRSLPVEKYWSTNVHEHATNLVMMATLDESQFAMGEGNYEIGAFVNGECRGSARLQKTSYGYVAFVVVHGEYDETISFKLYDVTNAMVVGSSEEQLRYVSNAIVGSVEEPMVLHFRGITDVNEEGNSLSMFPNPTKDNVKIQGQAIETVCVYNALGQCLINENYGNATDLELNLSGLSAGVYTVSIRTNGTVINKLVVKE